MLCPRYCTNVDGSHLTAKLNVDERHRVMIVIRQRLKRVDTN
jgi:hypothetical protein